MGRGLPNRPPHSDLTVVPLSCSIAQGAKGIGQWLDEMLLVSGDVRPHRMLSPLTGALISGFGNSPTSWSSNMPPGFLQLPLICQVSALSPPCLMVFVPFSFPFFCPDNLYLLVFFFF